MVDHAPHPAPLVPTEVDLTGFSSFMLDVDQLLASELLAVGTPEECWAAHLLMCRAWKQVPPASLPDDPLILAAFSGAGKRWSKVAKIALRDFVKCSDGRLYHRELAKEAVEAWERRKRFKDRSAKANERRWGSNPSCDEHGGSKEGEKGRSPAPQDHVRDEPRSIQEGDTKDVQGGSKKDPSGPRQDKTGQDKTLESEDTSSLRSEVGARGRTVPTSGAASRIDPGWFPDLVDRDYAIAQGLSEAEAGQEAEKFRDHWLAKPGADGRKADWRATWRTWCRHAVEYRSRNQARAGPPIGTAAGRPTSGARSAMAGILAATAPRKDVR